MNVHAAMATVLLAGASTVSALPQGYPVPETTYRTELSASFDELDRDKDGRLVPQELPVDHELATRFASFDRDGDSALSRSEFQIYLRGEETDVAALDSEDEEEEDDEQE